jgi:WD40 repeat protein
VIIQLGAEGNYVAGTVQFRDPRTFAPLGGPVTVAEGVVVSLAFSPDGSLLAAGDFKSAAVSTIRLVDVATRPDRGRTLGRSGGCFPVVQPRRHDDGDVVAEQHIAVEPRPGDLA